MRLEEDLSARKSHGGLSVMRLVQKLDERKIGHLIREATEKNHVTVAVYRAMPTPLVGGDRRRRVMHEQVPDVGHAPSLVLADIGRMLLGKKPVYLAEAIRLCGGELVGVFPNLRTNVGYDFTAANLSGTSVSVADTIALAASTRAGAVTDAETTLPWNTSQTSDTAPVTNPNASSGEITFGGLSRAAATYAHTVSGPSSGTTSWTLSKTWTASTTITSVQMAGLFGGSNKAAQGGTDANNMLFLQTKFTATTLANGDQLALTWTVTITG